MQKLDYVLLNVFTVAGDRLSGNPLCVFEDAAALDGARMQALARQFNLSETTFLLPATSVHASARVRIFTPDVEMPFAGHPTLGTAHVVRALGSSGDRVALEMISGVVEVLASGDRWTLRAPRPPASRECTLGPAALAAMLGIDGAAIGHAQWVDTGTEQLMVPLNDVAQVRAAKPDAALMLRDAVPVGGGAPLAYLFAETSPGVIEARSFFLEHGAVIEDPATGSACANLGGWLLAESSPLPLQRLVHQGAQVGRPSRLLLDVDGERNIRVSGEVVELGRGSIHI